MSSMPPRTQPSKTILASWILFPVLTSLASAADRPNILFVFSDDHATKAVSAYDDSLVSTPNIDRLAQEGARFTNCFATNSLCGPSRAVVLTGKHSHRNGKMTNDSKEIFNGAQTTFPKLLQQAGYQTALFGKWHLVSEPTGFDEWNVLPGQGFYYQPEFKTPDGPITKQGYVTDVVTDMSLDWLKERRDESKPFLLMLQHKAPHREVLPPIELLKLYQDQQFPEPATLFEKPSSRGIVGKNTNLRLDKLLTLSGSLRIPPDLSGESRKRGIMRYRRHRDRLTPEELQAWDKAYAPRIDSFNKNELRGKELTRWKYQHIMRDYLRTIVSIDQNLGRVLDYLDESGLAENTVVVYASDQGFFLGEHGLFNKRLMYEESIRMPLVVRWPQGTKPGTVSDHLVQNLDFAQTFLDLAEQPAPDDMQGQSLVPILRGEAPDNWRDAVYYHYYGSAGTYVVPKHCGVRTDRYKLIHYYELDAWELFDLAQDKSELNNLIDSTAHAPLVKKMKARLAAIQAEYREAPPQTSKRPGKRLN